MNRPVRPHPLIIVLTIVLAATAIVMVARQALEGGGGSHESITEHAGTLTWIPEGPNPDPKLASGYWTMTYPAAYASRVRTGVGIFVRDERIGFVRASEVDRGTVWVYLWIAPKYEGVAAGITESEPIETPDGPRIQIYKYSKVAPPGSTRALPPTATLA